MKKYLAVFILAVTLAFITVQAALAQSGSVYYVAAGDTLDGIAARFGVTAEAILRQNGLANPDFIYVGQALVIPDMGYGHNGEGYYNTGCANYHIVQSGETLTAIAWRYGVTVEMLMRQNNLYNQDFVYSGQKLCISSGGGYHMPMPQPASYQSYNNYSPALYYHTVSQGETLGGICERYGVNMWEVTRANNLTNASFLQPGQRLAIPGYAPQQAAMPMYNPAYNPPQHQYNKPEPPNDMRPHRPRRPSDKDGDSGDDGKPDVHLRLGRNVVYEHWGRPKYGLDDCSYNAYDDSNPAKRLTVEVLVTNNSEELIARDWALDVVFYLQSGAKRYACIHHIVDQTYNDNGKAALNPGAGYQFPGPIEPDQTVDVTFYTHLEKSDLALKMEFLAFDICIDPNSGDRISCD